MSTIVRRIRIGLISYLSLAMLRGPEPAAFDMVNALGTLLFNLIHITSIAYADENPSNTIKPARHPFMSDSKPAIWVNFTDPRPKGDDADEGAQPAHYPRVSVNNVSLLPAVEQQLINVKTPVGALDLSLSISYAPPVITYSYASGYSLLVSPTPFGHCWESSLIPTIEVETNIGVYGQYHYLAQAAGGNLPSVNFTWGNGAWLPEPLSKASFDGVNDVSFWQSGIVMSKAGSPSAQILRPGCADSYYYWPSRIYDRNSNSLFFSYGSPRRTLITFTDYKYVPIPILASNSYGDHLSFRGDSHAFVYGAYDNVTNYVYAVTAVTQCHANAQLRTVALNYTTFGNYFRLLSSVIFPDHSSNVYNYTSCGFGGIQVPMLSSIVTPNDSISIIYDEWDWPSTGCDIVKRVPRRVRIINNNGVNTQSFERTNATTMQTTTETGTVNQKRYQLRYFPRNMQWYGVELFNTLDNVDHHKYSADDRYRYTSAADSPNGTTWYTNQFSYDDRDNLTCVTDALDNVTRYVYAPNKLDCVCIIDPRGVVTTNIYDARGNLLTTIEDYGSGKLNRLSSNVYNTVGQVIKSFDPLGRITRNYYSSSPVPADWTYYRDNDCCVWSNGYLVATRDALGRVTTYTYDVFGRQIKVDAPGNSSTARYVVENSYDIMDRLTSTRYPDGTFLSNIYSAAGYPLCTRDRGGRWTTNTYDAAGHLLRVDYPNGDWVAKEYDGNLVGRLLDAAGNTTEYFYCHEQLVGVTFPDGSTRAAGFDNLNRQVWAVDERGVAVTNVYDALSRAIFSRYLPFVTMHQMPADVTSLPETFSPTTCRWDAVHDGFDGQTVAAGFDAVGNLTNLTDWAGTTTNAYDALNRLSCQAARLQAQGASVAYALLPGFDLADNRTALTATVAGVTAELLYAYDDLNRLDTLTCGLYGRVFSGLYNYNANGKVSLVRGREGLNTRVTTAYTYDTENRLSNITHTGAGLAGGINNLTYAYNNAQQIAAITEKPWMDGTWADSGPDTSYSYDDRDQLVREDGDGIPPNNRYAYDHAQNRISNVFAARTDTYSYSLANKLTNIVVGITNASNRYIYDLAGNLVTSMVNGAITVFRYNAQNKLARIEGQGFSYDFLYDSQNRRIASRRNSEDWRFDVHDGAICLASVTNGKIERFFVRGVGIAEGTGDVLAEIRGSDANSATAVFYVVNHRGDTLNAYVYDIGLIASYRYDAFGNVIQFSCAADGTNLLPRYTFSTKEYLPDAKVYLYAYRVYDPIAGRWTQRDPIDYQDSVNLYCFSKNNSINECDPDGQLAIIPLLIISTVGALITVPLYTYFKTMKETENKAIQKIRDGKSPEQEIENMQKATAATCEIMSSVLLVFDTMTAIVGAKAIPDNTGSPAKGPLKYNSAAGRYQTTQPVPGKPGQPFVSNRAGDTYMNNLAQGLKPNGGTTALPGNGAKQGAAAVAPTLFEERGNRRSR